MSSSPYQACTCTPKNSPRKYTFYSLGSAVLDLIASKQGHELPALTSSDKQYIDRVTQRLGGGALNIARELKRQGCKISVIAPIGNDLYGTTIKELCHQEQLCTCLLLEKKIASRFSWIIPTQNQTHIISYATTEQSLHASDLTHLDFSQADCLIVAPLHTPDTQALLHLIQQAELYNLTLVCIAGAKELQDSFYQELYSKATLLVCNRTEASEAFGEIKECITFFNKKGTAYVCVTADKDGVFFQEQGSEVKHLPAQQIVVKNSAGAGDIFTATLSYQLLAKKLSYTQAVTKALQRAEDFLTKSI